MKLSFTITKMKTVVNMSLMSFVVLLVVYAKTATADEKSQIQAMMYLQKFGYMNESNGFSASMISEEAMQDAVKDFQRFAGINVTGSLDDNTVKMMNTPRCGVRDKVGHADSARRRKRYALQGSKWRVTELTYKISKYPSRIKEQNKVDKEIARAFKVWSDTTPLTFVAKKSGRVHIDIRFESGEHGDGDPFDGPSHTLAHAFFPQYGGDVHFDDDEKWSINSYKGTNLFMVAAHEIGHSLGLSHSDVKTALMAPFYMGYDPNFKLDKDDVEGITALYGARSKNDRKPDEAGTGIAPRRRTDTGDAPDLCQSPEIDAVTRTADGNTYVFKGKYYWRIKTDGIADGYPRSIQEDWGNLPSNIDAALTWSDGKTFFFKGDKYWRYTNMKGDSGYPKDISVGFKGIPTNLDAALLWSGNGKTYFFKGDKYWRFDSRSDNPVSDKYPKQISGWEGLPNNLDAAFQWENGRTYFFKGKNYYRFNDNEFVVEKTSSNPYPRSTAVWWFDCKSMSAGKSGLEEGDRPTINIGVGGHNADSITESSTRESIPDDDDRLDIDGDDVRDSKSNDEDSPLDPKPVIQHDPNRNNALANVPALLLVLAFSALSQFQRLIS